MDRPWFVLFAQTGAGLFENTQWMRMLFLRALLQNGNN